MQGVSRWQKVAKGGKNAFATISVCPLHQEPPNKDILRQAQDVRAFLER